MTLQQKIIELRAQYLTIIEDSKFKKPADYKAINKYYSDIVTAKRNLYVLEALEGLSPEDLDKFMEIRSQIEKLHTDPEIKRIQYAYKLTNAEIKWILEIV